MYTQVKTIKMRGSLDFMNDKKNLPGQKHLCKMYVNLRVPVKFTELTSVYIII